MLDPIALVSWANAATHLAKRELGLEVVLGNQGAGDVRGLHRLHGADDEVLAWMEVLHLNDKGQSARSSTPAIHFAHSGRLGQG